MRKKTKLFLDLQGFRVDFFYLSKNSIILISNFSGFFCGLLLTFNLYITNLFFYCLDCRKLIFANYCIFLKGFDYNNNDNLGLRWWDSLRWMIIYMCSLNKPDIIYGYNAINKKIDTHLNNQNALKNIKGLALLDYYKPIS